MTKQQCKGPEAHVSLACLRPAHLSGPWSEVEKGREEGAEIRVIAGAPSFKALQPW